MTTPSLPLKHLLRDPRIWRGRGRATKPVEAELPTSHRLLDQKIPGGGWPRGALSEILIPAYGYGELELIAPALATLTKRRQRIICIAPPHRLHAPACQMHGIDLNQVFTIQSTNAEDALWATEQTLRSGTAAAVLCWPGKVTDRQLRRLQLAAEKGRCWAYVFRSSGVANTPSPAALRIMLGGNDLKLIKCRGMSMV